MLLTGAVEHPNDRHRREEIEDGRAHVVFGRNPLPHSMPVGPHGVNNRGKGDGDQHDRRSCQAPVHNEQPDGDAQPHSERRSSLGHSVGDEQL